MNTDKQTLLPQFEQLPEEKKERILSAGIREFSSKPYSEASTDTITREGLISKGLLFHYFGSKANFYLYCLTYSLKLLLTKSNTESQSSMPASREEAASSTNRERFFLSLFRMFEDKIILCMKHPEEMHLVNMASRENATAIMKEKNQILQEYLLKRKLESEENCRELLKLLSLKQPKNPVVEKSFFLYVSAVNNQYLAQYQTVPDQYFANKERMKKEMQDAICLLLDGIEKKGEA